MRLQSLGRRPTRLATMLMAGGQAGWGLADQSLSSLTNFAFGVAAARTLGPAGFGAFGIAFTTYLVALGVCRALACEPLVVRFSSTSFLHWRKGTESAVGAALTIAVIMGLLVGAIGLTVDQPVRDGLLGLGVILPGLLLQDAWRFVFFADGRGSAAFLNDLVWALLLLPLLLLLAAANEFSVLSLVLAWGGSATVAAILGLHQARLMPRVHRTLPWLREQRDLAPRYVVEFLASNGATQVVVFAVGALAGLSVLGNLRAGLLVLGPLNVLCQGLSLALLPRQVRKARHGPSGLVGSALITSFLIVSVTLTWGASASFAPSAIGRELLGPIWDGIHQIMLPLSIGIAGEFAMFGARVALRALADVRRSLGAGLISSLLVLIGGIGGASFRTTSAVITGLGMALWLGSVVWWYQLVRALRAPPDQRSTNDEFAASAVSYSGGQTGTELAP